MVYVYYVRTYTYVHGTRVCTKYHGIRVRTRVPMVHVYALEYVHVKGGIRARTIYGIAIPWYYHGRVVRTMVRTRVPCTHTYGICTTRVRTRVYVPWYSSTIGTCIVPTAFERIFDKTRCQNHFGQVQGHQGE